MNNSGGQVRTLVLAIIVSFAALTALTFYLQAGSEDSPNAASAAGLSAGEAMDGQPDSVLQRLGAYFEKQPRDARGLVLLARRQADAERFVEAAQAYEKALALPSKVAKDPDVWCEYADVLAMTQQGKLAGKPRELIDRALALNPVHAKALEMAGSAAYEQGNYASALRYWRALLALLEPGSRMHAELAAAIARTEGLAATSPQRNL